jgi:tetratricopeptide (TPR) repeat protein
MKLHKETLAARKRIHSDDHPNTLGSMFNLAICHSSLGQLDEAVKLFEETLTARKKLLPADHRATLMTKQYLAERYLTLGRKAEALTLFEESLATLRRIHPAADHQETLVGMWDVARTLLDLNRGAKAMPIIDELVTRAVGKPVDRRLIPTALERRLLYFQSVNDPAGCRATAAMWEKLDRRDPLSLCTAASFWAITAEMQAKAGGADAARLAKDDADKAMAWLTKAAAAGYRDAAGIQNNEALEVLWERDDFKKLMEKMEDGKKK